MEELLLLTVPIYYDTLVALNNRPFECHEHNTTSAFANNTVECCCCWFLVLLPRGISLMTEKKFSKEGEEVFSKSFRDNRSNL